MAVAVEHTGGGGGGGGGGGFVGVVHGGGSVVVVGEDHTGAMMRSPAKPTPLPPPLPPALSLDPAALPLPPHAPPTAPAPAAVVSSSATAAAHSAAVAAATGKVGALVGVPVPPGTNYYRRQLPAVCTDFSSAVGRRYFREALADGTLEAYFGVAAQFHTQTEPSFCGLSTLVVVLNTLAIDPGRLWKGVWRWYSEDMLDCCAPIEEIRVRGMTLDMFVCLARCNGVRATMLRPNPSLGDGLAVEGGGVGAGEPGAGASGTPPPLPGADGVVARYPRGSLAAFRAEVVATSRTPAGRVLVASFARKGLNQTGEGHFSPLAGYHAPTDSVLIMDVARFKYPPHWVSVPRLWHAMADYLDVVTGAPRGYVVLQASTLAPLLLFRLPAWVALQGAPGGGASACGAGGSRAASGGCCNSGGGGGGGSGGGSAVVVSNSGRSSGGDPGSMLTCAGPGGTLPPITLFLRDLADAAAECRCGSLALPSPVATAANTTPVVRPSSSLPGEAASTSSSSSSGGSPPHAAALLTPLQVAARCFATCFHSVASATTSTIVATGRTPSGSTRPPAPRSATLPPPGAAPSMSPPAADPALALDGVRCLLLLLLLLLSVVYSHAPTHTHTRPHALQAHTIAVEWLVRELEGTSVWAALAPWAGDAPAQPPVVAAAGSTGAAAHPPLPPLRELHFMTIVALVWAASDDAALSAAVSGMRSPIVPATRATACSLLDSSDDAPLAPLRAAAMEDLARATGSALGNEVNVLVSQLSQLVGSDDTSAGCGGCGACTTQPAAGGTSAAATTAAAAAASSGWLPPPLPPPQSLPAAVPAPAVDAGATVDSTSRQGACTGPGCGSGCTPRP